MVFKIHKRSLTCASGISYNEEKVLEKLAKVVSFSNMKCRSSQGVIIALQRLEQIPTRSNVKNKGFHLSINPAEDELMDDFTAAKLAKEVMKGLGYENQPWIMYKHLDIDRIHYHIVSTRVQKDGCLIPDSNDRYKLREIGIKLSQKYNYTYGKSTRLNIVNNQKIERFEPGKSHISDRIFTLINMVAQNYNFRNVYEYSKVMESLGVKIGRVPTRYENYYRWVFRGLDHDGNPCTKYIGKIDNIDPANDKPGIEVLIRRIAETKTIDKPSVQRQEKILQNINKALHYAQNKPVPEETFKNYMHRTGLDITLERNETTKMIEDILIVDHESKQVLQNADLDYVFNLDILNSSLPYRESKKRKRKATLKEPSIKDLVKQNVKEISRIATDVIEQYKEAFALKH